MDKLDILMIPFVYLLQMTLILFSVVYYFVPNPSKFGRELKSVTICIPYICLHVLLFLIYHLHCIVNTPLNILGQTQLCYILGYWPRFYWSLLKTQGNRRSIWTIISRPVPNEGPRLKREGIPCLW